MWIRSAVVAGVEVPFGRIVVLEGSPGSGKTSWLVRVLHELVPGTPADPSWERWVKEIRLASPLSLDTLLSHVVVSDESSDRVTVSGWDMTSCQAASWSGPPEALALLRRPVLYANSVRDSDIGALMKLFAGKLDLRRPEELLRSVAAISPHEPPQSLLHLIGYLEPDQWQQLVSVVERTLGLRLCWDDSQVTHWTLRVGTAPTAENRRQRARLMATLPSVDQLPRSQQTALLVLLCAWLLGSRFIMWDDAGEGLSPPAARKLGRSLAELTVQKDTQWVLAAPHPEMVGGLLEAQAELTVLRIQQTADRRIRLIPVEGMRRFYSSAQAKAQRVEHAAMAEAVILLENEVERAIFAALLRRPGTQADGYLAIHSFGPAYTLRVYQDLAACRVPTAAVVSADVLQDSERFEAWCRALAAGQFPQKWLALRQRIAEAVEGGLDPHALAENRRQMEQFLAQLHASGGGAVGSLPDARHEQRQKWRLVRRHGIQGLPPMARPWFEELADELKRYGLFLSPAGSVAHWFSQMSTASADWFDEAIRVCERGPCPAALEAFFQEILLWLATRRASTDIPVFAEPS
ncbi:MAG: hypothetical protein KatS3mg110_0200 [Pirellulaceae bacterium]|nr:MAG: hypothetical protein KatS3mg110_0200 [Pirellulaceae bacterium]